MSTFAEISSGQERTYLTQQLNDNESDMPGDPLVPDGGTIGSVVKRIQRTSTGMLDGDIFGPERISAYARERADLITRYAQLRAANSELHKLHKEFEDDLLVAACVQRHLEPMPIVWGRVRVDTLSRSARTVGGDFGIVCPLGDQHLNLLLGDVSGHGISAALAASHIYNETSTHLQTGASLGDVLSALNRSVIRKFNSPSFFFTVAAARFDRSGRYMVFAGAGHPPCMVIKPGGNPRLLEAQSTMLGALPNAVCHEPITEIDLEPGDRILLYTDGVTEVFDDRGEMLGLEGLQNFVRECSLFSFDEMLPAILERIAWRVGPFVDDVTLVLAEVLE